MPDTQYLLRPIGLVESPLKSKDLCPKQGSAGAPDAWLVIDPLFADGLDVVFSTGPAAALNLLSAICYRYVVAPLSVLTA